ncbi:Uncharacterised protein [Segatella copri]|nr:Uncharacterised protein [Segatella copri]
MCVGLQLILKNISGAFFVAIYGCVLIWNAVSAECHTLFNVIYTHHFICPSSRMHHQASDGEH